MCQLKYPSMCPNHFLLSHERCIICKLVHVMNIVKAVQFGNQSINQSMHQCRDVAEVYHGQNAICFTLSAFGFEKYKSW
jgi:hypothetical protein